MKEPTADWQYGRLSGFSWCCIGWFYVRLLLLKSKLPRKFYEWMFLKGVGFIVCPGHALACKLGRYKPKKFTCKVCGWWQIGSAECAVKEGHWTWVFDRWEKYHLSILENGNFYPNLGGDIGKLIRKNLEFDNPRKLFTSASKALD